MHRGMLFSIAYSLVLKQVSESIMMEKRLSSSWKLLHSYMQTGRTNIFHKAFQTADVGLQVDCRPNYNIDNDNDQKMFLPKMRISHLITSNLLESVSEKLRMRTLWSVMAAHGYLLMNLFPYLADIWNCMVWLECQCLFWGYGHLKIKIESILPQIPRTNCWELAHMASDSPCQ